MITFILKLDTDDDAGILLKGESGDGTSYFGGTFTATGRRQVIEFLKTLHFVVWYGSAHYSTTMYELVDGLIRELTENHNATIEYKRGGNQTIEYTEIGVSRSIAELF